MDRQKPRVPRAVVALAVAVGIAAGSYGIANAASGSGSSSGSPSSSSYAAQAIAATPSAPSAQGPWGGQRPDETLLTGDTKANVEKAALAKVPNGTIVRVETDADGNALYEAHMTKADGTPVTVYVDKSFGVVGVESR
jgi:hypothetical protein